MAIHMLCLISRKTISPPNRKNLVDIARTKYTIEEEDKIYFLCLKTWTHKKRSFKNTEKNRILYPELHKRIEFRENISVCYTSESINNEIDTIKKQLDINK